MPLGRAHVGHRLDDLVLGRQRCRQPLGVRAHVAVALGQVAPALLGVGLGHCSLPSGAAAGGRSRRREWETVPQRSRPGRKSCTRAPRRPGAATGGMLAASTSTSEGIHGGTGEFGGADRPGLAGFGALVARGAFAARGCAKRGAGGPRRRGVRPARLLRLGHRHPGLRPPGRRRRAPGQLPDHRPVLAHPGLPADWAQPPPQRDGAGGRPGHGLPGVLGEAAPGERLPLRDPAGPRLRHLRRRQVAPHPR